MNLLQLTVNPLNVRTCSNRQINIDRFDSVVNKLSFSETDVKVPLT